MSSSTDFEPHDRGAAGVSRFPAWLTLRTWQGRLFWLVLLIGPIWLLDKPLAELELHKQKIFLLGDIQDAARQFGEPIGIAWISMVFWILVRSHRRPLLVALVAAMLASGFASGAKLLVGRQRPKVSHGETILKGPMWPESKKSDPSFPSGHTTVAFAFAFGLSQMFPQHCKLWLFLAAGCGLSRATSDAHYLTDVAVGAWLGWELARLFWETPVGGWLIKWMDRRFPASERLPRWDWQAARGASPHAQASVAGGGT